MQDTVPAAEVADLCAAVREALTAPDPAGDYGAYEQLISTRAAYIRGALRACAAGHLGDVAATAQAVRQAARVVPVHYEAAAEGEAE